MNTPSGAPEVLVVGAGPVGLTAAHELARRGVRVRVVDRATGPATTSRATANHARTLEIYHQMGILAELLPRGRQVKHFTMHQHGRTMIRLGTDYAHLPTRFPFTLQVDQVVIEKVLRKRVRALGVDVEWGVGLENLEQHPDRVEAELRYADGAAQEVQVPWLVGADGGHSRVRDQLGLRLFGDSTQTWLVADSVVHADLPADSLHWMHTGNGTIMLVPFPDKGKWRLLDTVDIDMDGGPSAVAARFAAKISRALGRRVEVATPSWVSVFTIQQRMIQKMRVDRCFMAGDAAHVHSPASGQGMNTGIQDAYNLSWKLADVVRGHAGEDLLDSYGVERVPIAEKLMGSTNIATSLVALRNAAAPVVLPIGLGLLEAVKPLKRKVERKILTAMSGLALHYPHSPLSLPSPPTQGFQPGQRVGCSVEAERDSEGWRALSAALTDPRWKLLAFVQTQDLALEHVARRYGKAVAVLLSPDRNGLLRKDFGADTGDYALIRPDGYLSARGRLSGVEQLTELLDRVHLTREEHPPAQ